MSLEVRSAFEDKAPASPLAFESEAPASREADVGRLERSGREAAEWRGRQLVRVTIFTKAT